MPSTNAYYQGGKMSVKCGNCVNFTKPDTSDGVCEGYCEEWEQVIKNGTTHEKVAFYQDKLGSIPFFSDIERDCLRFEVIVA